MTATIELVSDESAAIISPIGAALLSFTVADRPVVVPMGAVDGAVLAPWPNRIAGGRFAFDGRDHQLPITEPERDTALHGLVADVEWTVTQRSESAVSLEHTLEPSQGYPFTFALRIDYELAEAGVRVRARARNLGSVRAPFGFGFHPWLSPGGTAGDVVDEVAVDGAQLVVPAMTWFESDDRLIPTKVRPFDDGTVIPADHAADESVCIVCKDFRALRTIGATVLDDAFGSPRRGDDAWSRARLRGTDDREIVVGMGPGFRTWQVCTGDGLGADRARRAIAIEPMTCPPNAFAPGTADDDFDIVAPAGELTVEWSIALQPASGSLQGNVGSDQTDAGSTSAWGDAPSTSDGAV